MTWEPVDPDEQKYLEIGEQLVMTRDSWFDKRMDFWDNIIVDEKWNAINEEKWFDWTFLIYSKAGLISLSLKDALRSKVALRDIQYHSSVE